MEFDVKRAVEYLRFPVEAVTVDGSAFVLENSQVNIVGGADVDDGTIEDEQVHAGPSGGFAEFNFSRALCDELEGVHAAHPFSSATDTPSCLARSDWIPGDGIRVPLRQW